jgi:DnaJ like chaperone protein
LNRNQSPNEQQQAIFFYTTFAVMGHVAKAKGRVSEDDIAFAQAYMDKWQLNSQLRQQARDAFREGKMAGFPLKQQLDKLVKSCQNRRDLLLLFMEIQIQAAFADGQLDLNEKNVLRTVGKRLGFSPNELERLLVMIAASASFHQYKQSRANYQQSQPDIQQKTLENAYQLLGIDPSANDQALKKAYKKLMAQHHPDKLVAKGLPQSMMEEAKQKAQEIQAAYQIICKSRGIK